jgi:lipoprotein-anchoring transpeptidase ErfK/SrfK
MKQSRSRFRIRLAATMFAGLIGMATNIPGALAAPMTTVPNATAATAPTTTGAYAPPPTSIIVAAKAARTPVYESATATKAFFVFDNKTNFSGRHVFYVLSTEPGGYRVLLPMRPNGRTGFVKTADVTVFQHDFAILVTLSTKTLTVFKGGKEIMRESVGIGQDRYPTPTGTFFARELARPSNPRGSYGPWAFGLSGYSNVLTKFGRGDGQIGIHGTNQPKLLGTKVSHGCIRMRNAAITNLAQTLPQGVPVEIRA